MVSLLVEHGVNINSRDGYPIRFAIARRYDDIIKILLLAGADVNISGNNGLTAFELALYQSQDTECELCKDLLRYGGKPPRQAVAAIQERYRHILDITIKR